MDLDAQLALMAATLHTDTQPTDKRAARRHQRDKSTVNRWRNIGKGSPCYAALQYVLRLSHAEAMRVAATFLSAARMVALTHKTTPELVALYWECRRAESDMEAADRLLDSCPPDAWDWTRHAEASERDAATDTLKASIERLFAIRKVTPSEVFGGGR